MGGRIEWLKICCTLDQEKALYIDMLAKKKDILEVSATQIGIWQL